jgi:hypothetical protein
MKVSVSNPGPGSPIVAWVDAGAPRGSLTDMPPPREFGDRDRWHIGEPAWTVPIPPVDVTVTVR